MSLSNLNYVTRGLYPSFPNYSPLVSNGSPISLNPTPKLNPNEDPSKNGLPETLNLSSAQRADLASIASISINNAAGTSIVPTQDGFASIGDGYSLDFDPDTLQGRITPALTPGDGFSAFPFDSSISGTYTGADVRLMIEASEQASNGKRYAKQLLEATTITVSVHREVSPVRASGYYNPKGFALGKRTIAGTLIVTQFTADVLFNFIQSILMTDGSKDSTFTKIDQLPPFNITMIFTNELGYASQRKLLGVKFVTDGVVYSIQDMMVEQTISWMALDFTPLVPLTLNNLFSPTDSYDRTIRRERTPLDTMQPPLLNDTGIINV